MSILFVLYDVLVLVIFSYLWLLLEINLTHVSILIFILSRTYYSSSLARETDKFPDCRGPVKNYSVMPKVRRSRKSPPEGWELIEPTLEELEQKMREGNFILFEINMYVFCYDSVSLTFSSFTAETEPHEGKRKQESLWPIFKIHHQKSRYIYDLFYRRKAISRELYQYCLDEKIADTNLIAKWKKIGYENLCCLRCIQTRDTNFATNCICRVPKSKLEEGRIVECVHCGCRGCSG